VLPSFRGVTRATVAAKSAAVRIVAGVARRAVVCRAHCSRSRPTVTARAGEALVLTVERERGSFVVVEAPDGPAIRSVAILAAGAEPRRMLVILAMALEARGRSLGEAKVDVALLTGECGVQAK